MRGMRFKADNIVDIRIEALHMTITNHTLLPQPSNTRMLWVVAIVEKMFMGVLHVALPLLKECYGVLHIAITNHKNVMGCYIWQ